MDHEIEQFRAIVRQVSELKRQLTGLDSADLTPTVNSLIEVTALLLQVVVDQARNLEHLRADLDALAARLDGS